MEESTTRPGGKALVAIDLAEKKIEKLSIISTLCHYLSDDDHQDATTFSNRSRKVRALLGTEVHDILVELVSCQKVCNKQRTATDFVVLSTLTNNENSLPAHHDLRHESPTRVKRKTEILYKLQQREDKRKFLRVVMTKANEFLQSRGIPATEDSTEQDDGEAGVNSQMATVESDYQSPTTVVGILRAALNSKYGTHVRRCFKELDVESLMSILYLLFSSGEPVASDRHHFDRPRFASSNSSIEEDPSIDQEIGSYYFLQFPESESPASVVEWDEEESMLRDGEIGIEQSFSEGTDKLDSLEDQSSQKSKIVSLQHQQQTSDELMKQCQILKGTKCHVLSTSSWTNDEITMFEQIETHSTGRDPCDCQKCKRQRLSRHGSSEDEYALVNSKMITLFNKLLAIFPAQIPVYLFDQTKTYSMFTVPIISFQRLLGDLRSVVLRLLTCSETAQDREWIHIGESTYRLLTIEYERIKLKLDTLQGKQKYKKDELDKSILNWQRQVENARKEAVHVIKESVKSHAMDSTGKEKVLKKQISGIQAEEVVAKESLRDTIGFVKQSTKSLRARRHYLEASLEAIIREYDSTMLQYQAKIDELSVEEIGNSRKIQGLQNKFKDIEEKYDEMRATKRLKELLKNMEKAEAIKQNWAARRIQVAWRKYKVAKLRKKRLKGKKRGGKKKTPPPQEKGKGLSPPKTLTPGSGSRSKSLTP